MFKNFGIFFLGGDFRQDASLLGTNFDHPWIISHVSDQVAFFHGRIEALLTETF